MTATRRVGLVLALGGLMVVVDTTVTAVAVPAMVAGLDSTLTAVQWVTTGYLLGIVAVLPLAGWSVNRFGGRRVYLVALLAFTVFSALAGLAPNAATLAVCRVLQGVGGGLLNPVGQAIGMRAVPRGARGRLMSLLGLPLIAGPVLGPPLGGWLVDAASWRWIFLINVPVGLLAMVLSARLLPADARRTDGGDVVDGTRPGGGATLPGPAERPRVVHSRAWSTGNRTADPEEAENGRRERKEGTPPVDWVGLGLLSGGGTAIVLGCTFVADPAGAGPAGFAALVGGVLLLAGFVRRTRRSTAPLVDLRLLRHRPLAAGLGVLAAFGAGYFGSITVLPLVVQGVRGDPAALAGALTVPQAVAVGGTVQVATRLVDRIAPRRIVLTGVTLGLAGAAALFVATVTDAPYPVLVGAAGLLGVGSGATILPMMTAALRDLDGADLPAGTTLLALVQQLAAAIGAAVVATTLTVLLAGPTRGAGVAALMTDPRPELAGAVGGAYAVVVVLMVVSLATAVLRVPRGG